MAITNSRANSAGVTGTKPFAKGGSPRVNGEMPTGDRDQSASQVRQNGMFPAAPSSGDGVGPDNPDPGKYLPPKASGVKQTFRPTKSGGVR